MAFVGFSFSCPGLGPRPLGPGPGLGLLGPGRGVCLPAWTTKPAAPHMEIPSNSCLRQRTLKLPCPELPGVVTRTHQVGIEPSFEKDIVEKHGTLCSSGKSCNTKPSFRAWFVHGTCMARTLKWSHRRSGPNFISSATAKAVSASREKNRRGPCTMF